MANKNLFSSLAQSTKSAPLPVANTTNQAGGTAYRMSAKAALAQLAATGCLNNTYYASAEDQLGTVLALAREVAQEDAPYLGRVALYARRQGFMKDMPALFCAILASSPAPLAKETLAAVFPRVIDNAKMLRNFAQIIRSGAVGRRSFGTLLKRLMQGWFASRTGEAIFRDSIGDDPSLADVIKMVHPRPSSKEQEATLAYLIGKLEGGIEGSALPESIKAFERWKLVSAEMQQATIPDVPFLMLTSQPLSTAAWTQIARTASWQTTRMSLNTFKRHGVFEVSGMPELLAARLRDPSLIAKSRVMPSQLYAAYQAATDVPAVVREALSAATDLALSNVPAFDKQNVFVCPDLSGSMNTPITGERKGSSSKVSCREMASLISAAILSKNPSAVMIPFSDRVHTVRTSRDAAVRGGVFSTMRALSGEGSGGTDCSCPIRWLLEQKRPVDLVIIVSDNESWMHSRKDHPTRSTQLWAELKKKNPNAKLVCVDLAPNTAVQLENSQDVLNVGGFSDAVFDVMGAFVAANGSASDFWVKEIERKTAE